MSRAAMYTISKERVLKELSEMNVTQKDLSDWLQTTPQKLCRDLNTEKVSKRTLLLISDLLSCDPEYLQGRSDQPRSNTTVPRPILKEKTPFISFNDENIYIETKPNSYTTLKNVIEIACKLGLRDRIREIINRAPD